MRMKKMETLDSMIANVVMGAGLGGEDMEKVMAGHVKRTWENKALTTEEIEKKIEALEEQILAWELEVRYEAKVVTFREVYMAWYESRLTLTEILNKIFEDGLCTQISPFNRD